MIPYCILASASPRRKELLEQAGFSFGVMPAKKEEQIRQILPEEIVKELSRQKADEIAERLRAGEQDVLQPVVCGSPFLIIGADTIVASADSILANPKMRKMLFTFSLSFRGTPTRFIRELPSSPAKKKELPSLL